MSACKFWLTFDEDWFARKVLWSDEKWFVLLQAPSKRNDRYWAEANPHNIIECNKQGGQKCMAWVGILDGRVLPPYWFEGSVNQVSYLDMLKNDVWPLIQRVVHTRRYWFQQDGASCHVTRKVMDFLDSKFSSRLISRNSEHIWPPYSPDLSVLDFSFWKQAMAEVSRCQPKTMDELKSKVNDFAMNMDKNLVFRMCKNIRKRAQICVAQKGGHFNTL